jgi:hypothetical protein
MAVSSSITASATSSSTSAVMRETSVSIVVPESTMWRAPSWACSARVTSSNWSGCT